MGLVVQHDTKKTFLLVALSLITLPLSLLLCSLSYVRSKLGGRYGQALLLRRQRCAMSNFRERTVLVTGVGMAKGLTLARAFYLSGHRVIGADFEENGWVPSCSGRYSRALSVFVGLPSPRRTTETTATAEKDASWEKEYVDGLLRVIRDNGVDLWVSCSGVAGAVEDTRARESVELLTGCRCVQLGPASTAALHSKDSFAREAGRLGLPVPETHVVTSRDAVLGLLSRRPARNRDQDARRRPFVLKPVGVDDAHRGDMTPLPIFGAAATRAHVAALPISDASPWILQQFIPGRREYCTHALVVAGEVRVFTACRSAELLMHYEPILVDKGEEAVIVQDMLAITREVAGTTHWRGTGGNLARERMTGHLSFDFMIEEEKSGGAGAGSGGEKNAVGEEEVVENVEARPARKLYAIECNPRVHTAVVLMTQPDIMEEMVQAYLSVLDTERLRSSSADPTKDNKGANKDRGNEKTAIGKKKKVMMKKQGASSSKGSGNGQGLSGEKSQVVKSTQSQGHPASLSHVVFPGPDALPRYWIGHDLVVLGLLPLVRFVTGEKGGNGVGEVISDIKELIRHVLFWKEGTFEVWDPLPFLALYHLYWPIAFLEAWWQGRRWSRINVSTTKMFEC